MAWIIGQVNEQEMIELINAEVEWHELTEEQGLALFGKGWDEECNMKDTWVTAYVDVDLVDLLFPDIYQ